MWVGCPCAGGGRAGGNAPPQMIRHAGCVHTHIMSDFLRAISLNLFNIFIISNLDLLFYYAQLQFISFS